MDNFDCHPNYIIVICYINIIDDTTNNYLFFLFVDHSFNAGSDKLKQCEDYL